MDEASRTCLEYLSSEHMTELSWLVSLYSEEKWLDIQAFTNFTAVHFVVKCHVVNTPRRYPIYDARI